MRNMRSVMWGLLLLGCGRAESPSLVHCAPADAKARAIALQQTIAKGAIDRCAVAEDAPADIEIRDALVETDERSRENHTGHAALSTRLQALAARTIDATGPLRCYGACCDVEHRLKAGSSEECRGLQAADPMGLVPGESGSPTVTPQ